MSDPRLPACVSSLYNLSRTSSIPAPTSNNRSKTDCEYGIAWSLPPWIMSHDCGSKAGSRIGVDAYSRCEGLNGPNARFSSSESSDLQGVSTHHDCRTALVDGPHTRLNADTVRRGWRCQSFSDLEVDSNIVVSAHSLQCQSWPHSVAASRRHKLH